jgi:hypothetical protein
VLTRRNAETPKRRYAHTPKRWNGVEIHLRIRLAKGFGNRASYCLRIAAIKSVFLSGERRDRTLNGGRPCLDSSGNIAAPL